jgi:polar amino acid transport system substrate-binding protein
MKRIFIYLSILIFTGWTAFLLPGCSRAPQQIRIAIDPNWYPLDFQDKQFYINGFVDELLLEISRHSNVEFVRIGANWDTLLDGLKQRRYEAVLSSLATYPFNQSKYDFSSNFLDIGPVLVTHNASKLNELSQMSDRVVGVLSGNQEWFLMQKYPGVIMRSYDAVPEIFNALNNGEVEGIVIDRLIAIGFVKGTYAGSLKINGSPLTDAGLHLVTLKGDSAQAVKMFNKNLRYLTKKKKLQKLLKKWQLDV